MSEYVIMALILAAVFAATYFWVIVLARLFRITGADESYLPWEVTDEETYL